MGSGEEPDPQSICVSLSKQMEMGTRFDVLCYLDEAKKKAAYVVLVQGQTKVTDIAMTLCANYSWDNVPDDGQTLRSEDLDLLGGMSRTGLLKYALGEATKVTKACDLSQLPKSDT